MNSKDPNQYLLQGNSCLLSRVPAFTALPRLWRQTYSKAAFSQLEHERALGVFRHLVAVGQCGSLMVFGNIGMMRRLMHRFKQHLPAAAATCVLLRRWCQRIAMVVWTFSLCLGSNFESPKPTSWFLTFLALRFWRFCTLSWFSFTLYFLSTCLYFSLMFFTILHFLVPLFFAVFVLYFPSLWFVFLFITNFYIT